MNVSEMLENQIAKASGAGVVTENERSSLNNLVNGPADREQMTRRQNDFNLGTPERLNIAIQAEPRVGDNSYIEPSIHDFGDMSLCCSLDEIELDSGMLTLKIGHQSDKKNRTLGLEEFQSQPRLPRPAQPRSVLGRRPHPIERRARPPREMTPGNGQLNAVRFSLKQRNVKFVFQRLKAPTDG